MTLNIDKVLHSYNVSNTYQLLIVLAALHDQKLISDAKLKGQLQSLRAGALQKCKGTHHSSINNRWYSYESALEVYTDIATMLKYRTIQLDTLFNYILLFTNKGYNYAINVFVDEYVKRELNSWNPSYHIDEFFKHIGLETGWEIKASKYTHSCYECGSSHTTYDKKQRDAETKIADYFHTLKKGNLSKIPKHTL